jgi:membrane protein required for colicin V production
MATVDIALIAVLAASVIVGLARGLVFEVLSLVGWVVAYVAAQCLATEVAPHVPVGRPGSAVNYAAAFGATFVLVLVVWAILARLVRLLIHATPLSAIDRVLGAGFGLLRGLMLLMVVATVVALTPWSRSTAWQSSQGASWLKEALAQLKPVLPEDVARHLP